jgi:hypothetical protein
VEVNFAAFFSIMVVTSNRAAVSFMLLGLLAAELLQNYGTAAAESPDLLHRPASFGLKVRDAQTSTVPFGLMPACAQKFCISADNNPFANQAVLQSISDLNCGKNSSYCPDFKSLPTISCSKTSTSCPQTVIDITGSPTGCNTYSLGCYCEQATPLACAYLGCPLYDYLLAEDWLLSKDVCPNAPNVTFDGLPDCAKSCMIKQSILNGCVGPTKSCFCTQQTMFGCPNLNCEGTDSMKNSIAHWYDTQCSVGQDVALAILNKYINPANSNALTRKGLQVHWYEALAIACIGMSLLVTLSSVVWLSNEKDKIERRNLLLNPKDKGSGEKTAEPLEEKAEDKEQSKTISSRIDEIEEKPTGS